MSLQRKAPATLGVTRASNDGPPPKESSSEQANGTSALESQPALEDRVVVPWPDGCTTRQAAEHYISRGWQPVPLKPGEKKPQAKHWPEQTFAAENFGAADNIGIKLGSPSLSLIDIDLDIKEARLLADILLDDYPAFGRSGAARGHRLVRCVDAPNEITQFRISEKKAAECAKSLGLGVAGDKAMILELRSKGQTMFPPSVHPSGERVEWPRGKPPEHIPTRSYEQVREQLALIAFLAVVARAYPSKGSRDNCCLALSGTLSRLALSDEQVDRLVEATAKVAGDEEWHTRGKAKRSMGRLEEGKPTQGLPALLELLGLEELDQTFRKWLGMEADQSLPPGTIMMKGGALADIVSQAEAALIAWNPIGIFQRGTQLVRLVRHAEAAPDGIRRPTDARVIIDVNATWLREQMAKAAPWARVYHRKPVLADPEAQYANTLLARSGEWGLPVLRAVLHGPTIRRDGTILQTPGYDAAFGLLLEYAEGEFPPIPEEPTEEDARAALAVLERPFREFPFVDDSAKSVTLAAILTGIARPALRSAPLFAFDAPTAGTGKSMLVECVGTIVSGHAPPAMSQGKSAEEDEKRLQAALRRGDTCLLIDNCERRIEGDFLCSVLTQEQVQFRILGKSEDVILATCSLVMATGNNLAVRGDMSRRTLLCRLDARMERPDSRSFDFDPRDEVRRTRGGLVAAGLTILRAYIVAGKPGLERLTPYGSFEDFALIRGALAWLGRADPLSTRERVAADDPVAAERSLLFRTWYEALGHAPYYLHEVEREIMEPVPGSAHSRLRELLHGLSRDQNWNAKSIGHALRRMRDTIVDGLTLVSSQPTSSGVRWRVEQAGIGSGADADKDDLPF